jgi:carbon starvation protein
VTAPLAVAACLVLYALGYVFYSRFLGSKVFALDPDAPTPAHTLRDDVDYLPTRPAVLFGHHFASITGLAPMLGPAVAVIWGWLPAMIWVVFGAILVGSVHDFSALVLSVRHKGMSIGAIAEDLLGRRAKMLFHGIIFFGVSLAMGVFVIAISGLLGWGAYPQAILPSAGLMIVAATIGVVLHRGKASLGPTTVAGFCLLLLLIYAAVKLDRFGVAEADWPSSQSIKLTLLGYGFLASVLPVWSLLQPRDFINSLLLYLGLGGMYLGFFMSGNDFAAPAVVMDAPGSPPMLPFVFITIACGAASGFHALVASGTTAKQLDREVHARPIGYGAMIGESLLGLLAVIACTAGVLKPSAWEDGIYQSWQSIKGPGVALSNFIDGGASFLWEFGLPEDLARSFVAVVVVSFALTTLDSATRLLRYNVEEISSSAKMPCHRFVSSFIAVLAIAFFCFYRLRVESVGADGSVVVTEREAGMTLWQLFGTTNQLLAAMTLMLATRYLSRRGPYAWVTGVPMLLILVSTLFAMGTNLQRFIAADEGPLAVVGGVLLLMAAWLCVEGLLALRRDARRGQG